MQMLFMRVYLLEYFPHVFGSSDETIKAQSQWQQWMWNNPDFVDSSSVSHKNSVVSQKCGRGWFGGLKSNLKDELSEKGDFPPGRSLSVVFPNSKGKKKSHERRKKSFARQIRNGGAVEFDILCSPEFLTRYFASFGKKGPFVHFQFFARPFWQKVSLRPTGHGILAPRLFVCCL